mgnify:CR=1 FL=1
MDNKYLYIKDLISENIGLLILFGTIIGVALEQSKGTLSIAQGVLKYLHRLPLPYAVSCIGYLVSIPVFCDAAFVILSHLNKTLSEKTKTPLVGLTVALSTGLFAPHVLVPPTPGPLFVAEAFGVEIGTMIFWGILTGIPMVIVSVIYIKWVGKNIVLVPNNEGVIERVVVANVDLVDLKMDAKKGLPSAWLSFAPIFLPIILILIKQLWGTLADDVPGFIALIGHPVVSVSLGTLLAIYGLGNKVEKTTLLNYMDAGIKSAGIILLVTGAGGALGQVIKTTGVGNYIADAITTWGLPAILLPFFIATLVRFIQGSGTVSLITAASISAPILATMDVNPVFAALSAMIGGLFFSYFNDSYFHVINRSLELENPREQMKFWTGATTVSWVVGIVTVLILNLFFGGIA